jgi:hypothetical protein
MSDERNYRAKIEELLIKYTDYFDSTSWPKAGTEEFTDLLDTWCEAFGEKRYSPGMVARACLAIRRKPPQWKQEHLPELLRLIAEQQTEASGQTSSVNPPDDSDAPPCPICTDTPGFATAYRDDHRDHDGLDSERIVDDAGVTRIVFYRITGPCVCPRGRRIWAEWLKDHVKSQDLASLPRGWHLEGETRVMPPPRGAITPY